MQKLQYAIKHNIPFKHVIDLLSQNFLLSEIHHKHVERRYLDSFDWRMYRNNLISGVDSHENENIFFVKNKDSEQSIWELTVNEAPKFYQDIESKHCQVYLSKILSVRALMPILSLNISQRHINILNKEHKTIVKIFIENYTLDDQKPKNKISSRLIVSAIKGYEKAFNKVSRFIEQELKLGKLDVSLLDDLLKKLKIKSQTNKSGFNKKITDSLNTWDASRILLQDLLETMLLNEPGLRSAIDTEFLHEYRVAVRRTRSALTQIKQVFSEKELVHFKQSFYWLGTITTPTRDLDVYLLKFDQYVSELPPQIQIDILPLQLFLKRHWQEEHDKLCTILDSDKYHSLIKEWQMVLDREVMESPHSSNATKPAKEVANKRIWKLYKRVLKEGKAISPQSPDDDLHELRKSCKKFRYMMEFFQDYYPAKNIKQLIKALKQLQNNLGDFQDLCVQIDQLNKFAQQMQDEKIADTKAIMAMGVLVEKLTTRKQEVRSHSEERFKDFASDKTIFEFKSVFDPKLYRDEV